MARKITEVEKVMLRKLQKIFDNDDFLLKGMHYTPQMRVDVDIRRRNTLSEIETV